MKLLRKAYVVRTLCLNDPYDEDRNGAKMISMVFKNACSIDVVFIMFGNE